MVMSGIQVVLGFDLYLGSTTRTCWIVLIYPCVVVVVLSQVVGVVVGAYSSSGGQRLRTGDLGFCSVVGNLSQVSVPYPGGGSRVWF